MKNSSIPNSSRALCRMCPPSSLKIGTKKFIPIMYILALSHTCTQELCSSRCNIWRDMFICQEIGNRVSIWWIGSKIQTQQHNWSHLRERNPKPSILTPSWALEVGWIHIYLPCCRCARARDPRTVREIRGIPNLTKGFHLLAIAIAIAITVCKYCNAFFLVGLGRVVSGSTQNYFRARETRQGPFFFSW